MLRARRSAFLLFHLHDEHLLDLDAMLRGVVHTAAEPRLQALSILRGEEVPLEPGELETLYAFPAGEWVDVETERAAEVEALARKGLVVVDGSREAELDELRRREESLASNEWNLYAAAYHFMTRWRDVDVTAHGEAPEISASLIEQYVELYGRPAAFHELSSRPALELPLGDRDGDLYSALLSRRTTRAFSADAPVELDDFASVMRFVFGCHGWAPFIGEHVGIKRTSPSGGGLHAVEAYPLVSRVRGIEPGLYHYRTRDHALELVRPVDASAAVDLATALRLRPDVSRLCAGERRPDRALVPELLEVPPAPEGVRVAAHGRRAPEPDAVPRCGRARPRRVRHVAVNSAAIDDVLELDPASEGTIAVVGFGPRVEDHSPREPDFRPYRLPRA